MSKARPVRAVETATERASRPRQRQKLIEACISALYAHGPSRTTVDKVVAIAEMSPGIVSFYFDSKAAMLVAALQFLADEFEQQVLAPVAALSADPVKALEKLVQLMLDPEIASPRKVSVWYAFWGEANSRQEYYDICGKKDDAFAAIVRELIERVMAAAQNPDLDAEAVALGLIGVLEIQWQNIAFQDEADIDRQAAERCTMAYLRSIFPRQFAGRGASERRPAISLVAAPSVGLPGWAYADAALHAEERRRLFLPAWHCAGPESLALAPGDYFALEISGERALILRDPAGRLVAWHNSCRHRPHALVPDGPGHLDGVLTCPVEGTTYAPNGAGLHPIDLALSGGLVFLRFQPGPSAAPTLPPSPDNTIASLFRDVEADWKTVLEQLLETGAPARQWLFPNVLIETQSDGISIWQVEPLAPGRSRLRRIDRGRTMDPSRLADMARLSESTQAGFASSLYVPDSAVAETPAIAAFHAWLRANLPATALQR